MKTISLADAAKLALVELKQLHSHFYTDCKGGCPTDEAIKALETALADKDAPIASSEENDNIFLINGIECLLFEGKRVAVTPNPDFPHKFEARHADDDISSPATLEKKVTINFWGTVFAQEKFTMEHDCAFIESINDLDEVLSGFDGFDVDAAADYAESREAA